MAETATKTTTPRRPRAATTKAPAKAPAAKTPTPKAAPAAKAETPPPPADDRVKVTFALSIGEETKRYQKFDLSMDEEGNATGCVGVVYAPLGTEEVKILLIGPAGTVDDVE